MAEKETQDLSTALRSGRDDHSFSRNSFGGTKRTLALQQNCHLDRSVAEWRDLRFFEVAHWKDLRFSFSTRLRGLGCFAENLDQSLSDDLVFAFLNLPNSKTECTRISKSSIAPGRSRSS